MEKKNPWIAAILNFFLMGLGYVYVGKRVGFGLGILITSLILWWGVSANSMPAIVLLDSLLMGALFAYDGYKTAEEVNNKKK